MIAQNPLLQKLKSNYLFANIAKKREAFLKENPSAALISLGIGDTTLPLPPFIAAQISLYAQALSTQEGYHGYGPTQGSLLLRQKIAATFYPGQIAADELFISDGAKPDIGRLQLLFGKECSIALQDPAYPVYADTGALIGQSQIEYLPCLPENNFFPDYSQTQADILFICSPNNPTGAVATRQQLQDLVAFAKKHQKLIVFDSAYSAFITDPSLPKSIYEIEGSQEVAIEVSSFSKIAGFTGIRLGWTIVPKALRFKEGSSVHASYERIASTFFNGPSILAEAGGLAVLEPEGLAACHKLTAYYLENAQILKAALPPNSVYGGSHAPYLWLSLSKENASSWDAFENLLQQAHIIAVPGVGFGPSGEGFLRLSAFNQRPLIEEAAARLKAFFHSR